MSWTSYIPFWNNAASPFDMLETSISDGAGAVKDFLGSIWSFITSHPWTCGLATFLGWGIYSVGKNGFKKTVENVTSIFPTSVSKIVDLEQGVSVNVSARALGWSFSAASQLRTPWSNARKDKDVIADFAEDFKVKKNK